MAGRLVHYEIPAKDTAKAREFWGSLFGWEFQQFPEGAEYYITQITEQLGGAVSGMDPNLRGPRAYFDVDDIDAAARVRELGGEASERMPVTAMGWFVGCKDTLGNDFGLWRDDPAAPPMEAPRS